MTDRGGGSIAGSRANTVLVIEDMDDVRRAISAMLKALGYEVMEARDGSAAVHLYGEHSAKIAAATLDLMMPTTDGRETLAMLSEFAPRLPIMISTALPQPDNLLGRLPGTRGIGYLQKPYTISELDRELRRIIAEERDVV